MMVTVENVSTLGRRLTIKVPITNVQSIIEQKMDDLSTKAKIDGFRQGRVPRKVLDKHYGKEVRKEAYGKVIEQSLPLALEEKDLHPASRPMVERIEEGQDLQYVVSFEVFPDIVLSDLSNIQLETYDVIVTESDIDKTIEKLQNQFATWVVVDRPAHLGDRLTIDYQSTLNGKPYENNQGKDVMVILGSQMFIEGFEAGLIGSSAGEEKMLDLHFPNTWRIEKLAGKPVQFKVQIHKVEEKELGDIDEGFAKKIGASTAQIQDIRKKVREGLEAQIEEIKAAKLKENIADALVKLHPLSLPEALVNQEMTAMHEDFHQKRGDRAEGACHHPDLKPGAEKRVALGLILNKVIVLNNIVPDDVKVRAKIEGLVKHFGNADFLESMYSESEDLLSGVRRAVLIDQAFDWVKNQAKIVVTPTTMEALFGQEVK